MFLADRRGPCRRRDGDAIGHREQEAASLPLVLLLVVLQALPRRPAPAVPAQAACRAASATPRREVEEEEGARPAVDEDGSVGQVRAREKAMVINLEFIRAIVTADEVLLLEPLAQEVIPFIDKLRRHFPLKSVEVDVGATQVGNVDGKHAKTGAECGLPFEFQVLELALEAVCLSFHSSLSDLNKHAIFVLDELTENVSTRNLERVRSLKRNLTSLLAGVHKVRDEVEHLLDHNENRAQLHLSRKQIKSPQDEALLVSSALNCNFPSKTNLDIRNSVINQGTGIAVVAPLDDTVGDLEMLLESYFMQLDGIRNRITMVRGYIVDTEDYINIQLDNLRNGLIQLHLILIIVSFGISTNTLIAASFAINMPNNGDYKKFVGDFWQFVGGTSSFCLLVIVVLLGYAWRNRLLGS
uniref:Magnesium transporter n=1 Tax=Sorghum bicolor TaxID=4558 RepID=Q1KSC0_SORBI|nr:putative corA-like Mg++ transporter protein [Sorghum bicolor]